MKENLHHAYFPSSALHGPWFSLLQFHPRKGLDFVVKVLNHSAEWYTDPRVPSRGEPPFEIEVAFEDGSSRKQWGNLRLWNWYRGTADGPYVLQCLLMALERWLLEFAEARPAELDAVLLDLLRRSGSVALTAVVASAATAFPRLAGETLLVLLRSPTIIRLDRRRLASESQTPSRLANLLPSGRVENEIYQSERKSADARPHRRRDLEAAIASLQLGRLAARVHEILDEHRGALPPASEQSEDDRVWRISMNRMDLRRYSVAEVAASDALEVTSAALGEPGRRLVRLEPHEPDPDVKQMVDKSGARFNAMNARLGLLMWALHVFKKEEASTSDPANWRQQLSQSQTPEVMSLEDDELDASRGGPSVVAAVCVRDHWQEMSGDEQDWCVETVCSEVMRRADVWSEVERLQRFDMSADRPCASAISVLVGKSLSEKQRLRVREAFAAALTHPIDEVRWYAAWGVAFQLWSINHELAMRCVNALATEATLVEQAWVREDKRPYDQRREPDEILAEAALSVRQRFWRTGEIANDAYQTSDAAEYLGTAANARILAILSGVPTEPAAVAAFRRAAQRLVEWWDSDDDRKRGRVGNRRPRNREADPAVSELLQGFVMRTSSDAAKLILQPVLDAVDRHPRETLWIVRGLIGVEDREPNTQHFWFVWGLFADAVRRAGWLSRLDDEYSIGNGMVFAIFLGTSWKEEVRHWRSLEGHGQHVHALFEDLPPTSVVLDAYVRFLYHIGEQSLPEALVRIAMRLQSGDACLMLKKANTVFMLEVLLQRHVYGRPLELKRNPRVRDAVLLLLDWLVENGSSAAFRMRDDFVTPTSGK